MRGQGKVKVALASAVSDACPDSCRQLSYGAGVIGEEARLRFVGCELDRALFDRRWVPAPSCRAGVQRAIACTARAVDSTKNFHWNRRPGPESAMEIRVRDMPLTIERVYPSLGGAARFPLPCRRRKAPDQGFVKKTNYPTPQDAESAFYEALEGSDLDAMMEVWAEDEEIVCVHPGGERLVGYDAVRSGWAQIAASGSKLKVHLSDQTVLNGMMVTVHSMHENIRVEGEQRAAAQVAVTNVYLRTGNGWRMIVHHASPVPQRPTPAAHPSQDGPKILH